MEGAHRSGRREGHGGAGRRHRQPLVSARLRRHQGASTRQGPRHDPHHALQGLRGLRAGAFRLRPAPRARWHQEPDPADLRDQGRHLPRAAANQRRGAWLEAGAARRCRPHLQCRAAAGIYQSGCGFPERVIGRPASAETQTCAACRETVPPLQSLRGRYTSVWAWPDFRVHGLFTWLCFGARYHRRTLANSLWLIRRSIMTLQEPAARPGLSSKARELMEQINADAGKEHIWVRTQMNAPAQRPWFTDTGGATGTGSMASGRVAANQMKSAAYRWRGRDNKPYLDRRSPTAAKADVPPIEFADRQSILLTNPGLNGRLQVTNTIRCAISIYNPGDIAPAHVHSPNASRTILSDKGGYTNVEGER